MKKLLILLALALPFGAYAYTRTEAHRLLGDATKKDLTIINEDNVRYELHGRTPKGVTWKFYIQPGEHMSELIPIPGNAQELRIAGKPREGVNITGNSIVTIKGGKLSSKKIADKHNGDLMIPERELMVSEQ